MRNDRFTSRATRVATTVAIPSRRPTGDKQMTHHPVVAIVYVLSGSFFLATATGKVPGWHPTKPLARLLLGAGGAVGLLTAVLVLLGH